MPMYLYLNPAVLGYLLSPLLEYQESTQYTNPYAAQDLGKQPQYVSMCSVLMAWLIRLLVPERDR